MIRKTELIDQIVELAFLPTKFGWFGFAMEQELVLAVTIGNSSKAGALCQLRKKISDRMTKNTAPIHCSQKAFELLQDFERYTSGEQVDFRKYRVSLDHLTPFQTQVMKTVRNIDFGETLSYAEVAEGAGSPRAARAVGNVMANNRTPILIPCHRVLAAGGRWGGFTAPGGIGLKQGLLNLESINLPRKK